MLESLAGPPRRTHGEHWASSCAPTANLGTRALWGGVFAEPTALEGRGNMTLDQEPAVGKAPGTRACPTGR